MREKSWLLSILLVLAAAGTHAAESTMTFGRFGTVQLYEPAGPPRELVLFISGDGGWNLGVVEMARHLAERGALVAGIDIRRWGQSLRDTSRDCIFTAGDLEELAHAIEARQHFPAYISPLLVGYSSGATLAYTSLVQSPRGTFKGALSLGFGPDLPWPRPMCRGSGPGLDSDPARPSGFTFRPAPALHDPWITLHGEQDQVCDISVARGFVAQIPTARLIALPKVGHGFGVEKNWLEQFLAAYDELTRPPPAPAPAQAAMPAIPAIPASPAAAAADVTGLPLVEVPATGRARTELAVMLSGDGGWAGLDRELGDVLAGAGIPVVGWDSLRYFWKARTPEAAARDLDRIIRHYLTTWGRERVVLIGYSFGADALLPLLNRLPADTRGRVSLLALLAPGRSASFEFHLSDWVSSPAKGMPLLPEAARLQGTRLLCLYGTEETDALCPLLSGPDIQAVQLPGGHHFEGNYAGLGQAILRAVP